jgi:hypothetical protein
VSDLDHGHNDARHNWQSPFQFELNGGLGVEITATTTSARVELVGEGFTISVVNDGDVSVSLALGDDTVVATTAHKRILAGIDTVFTLRPESNITHAAVICRTGTTNVQITRGNGG